MPNLCSNEICIKYRKLTEEQMNEIRDKFCERVEYKYPNSRSIVIYELDFDKFIKEPKGLSDSDKIGWRMNNWGVKSGAYCTSISEKGIYFDTPWSPITDELLEAICDRLKEVLDEKQMKRLVYRYEEPGFEIKGSVEIGKRY